MNNPNNPQNHDQSSVNPEPATDQTGLQTEEMQAEEQELSELAALDGQELFADVMPETSDLDELALLDGVDLEAPESDVDIADELAALQAMDGLSAEEVTAEEILTVPAKDIEPEVDQTEELIDEQSLSEQDWQGYTPEYLTPILEAAVFAHGKPLSLERMLTLFDAEQLPSRKCLQFCLQQLAIEYRERGVNLVEVKSGWRFQTNVRTGEYVQRLWDERPQRYTRATLETLALIAYRQPITRGEIEDVRGVSVSTQIVKSLQERDWIRVVGHRDVPGRPAMYATTREFLDYFGLKSLTELPSLSEIKDLDDINPELDLAGDESDADETSDFDKAVNEMKAAAAVSEEQSYIDQELSNELAAMDSVNMAFEQMLAAQRASLKEDEESAEDVDTEQETSIESKTMAEADVVPEQAESILPDDETMSFQPDPPVMDAENLSEDEKIAIIQAKLAAQAKLLAEAEEQQDDNETED
ncbi:SMC-Scp complex subunit ScpB [Gynuella sunshinyii]|uniref:Putative transcriptional regulator containing the HTH domain n=1 Tax=Gynuella sunshinyii YC6258 TaxID=1445510 RepID=A0A0C5VP80_9GAMM|nr:SMC-Scp complex subunit ScpB [Gynuella sunshinyii]AJQ96462.1 putative transcriptional regulator containing the HTH domain [Gynuella sunshinyii YC6258]